MIPPIPELEDYDLASGFMPAEQPLERLEDEYYAPWERIMDKFHGLLLAGRLREAVLKVPFPKKWLTVSCRCCRLYTSRRLRRRDGHMSYCHF
jgi:hypothetical protein